VGKMKKITILSLVILLSLSFLAFADETAKNLKKKGLHVADLSEEDKINLQINKLEQAIKQQKIFSKNSLTNENALSKLRTEEGKINYL
jgi:hypothetical protein